MKKIVFLLIILVMNLYSQTDEKKIAKEQNFKSLVQAERDFSAMSVKEGIKKSFLANFAEDGIIFRPEPANGREVYSTRKENGNYLYWEPEFAEVSDDGDIGFSTGPWEWRKNINDTSGKIFGHYISVWKKQVDNSWKLFLDIGINHGPKEVKQFDVKTFFPENKFSSSKTDSSIEKKNILNIENKFSKGIKSAEYRKKYCHISDDDIKFYRDGNYPSKNKDEMKKMLESYPGMLSWENLSTYVPKSCDLAYSYGYINIITENDKQKYSYLHFWRKTSDNKWKIILDVAIPHTNKN